MDELGKSIPAAEGFVAAETDTNAGNPHPNENCLNCGTKLEDLYCHHCGQKDIPRRQTLGELFINFISSFWSYEGKFFQTTKYVFLKPGFLAVEYNEGRRETYFHPARMYVFVSFLFFLLLFSLPEDTVTELTEEDKKELQDDKRKMQWSFKDRQFNTHQQYDSAQNAVPEDQRDGWITQIMQHRAIEIRQKYGDDANAMGKDFLATFVDNFSKVLFYLMPFFALVLKLLYVRRDYYYSEHLVLTIYYYNFFYLAGCLIMLCNQVAWLGFMSVAIGIWIYIYLLFAMKRMYGQGWGKTILKFAAFSFLFFILVLVGVTINGVVALMSL